MNDQERFRYDAFVRMRQFGLDNKGDFPPGSIGDTQFAENAAVVDLLDVESGEQAASFGDTRFAFVGKATARENLRDDLSAIARTARSMNYQFPGIAAEFRMPRNNNDQQLLAAARAFHTETAERNDDFVAYGLPDDFRADLQSDIDAFEASLGETGSAIDSHVEATAEVGEIIRRGMVCRRILDGVVKNKYRDDVGKLAAWLSASHIEKAPKAKAPPANP